MWRTALFIAVIIIMLKSCKYCGRIHDAKYICDNKTKVIADRQKHTATPDNTIQLFRWSKHWKNKRDEIKKRDNYCCVVCMHNLYNTVQQYNINDLSVHHIEPLKVNYDKRLDNNNLVTLCSYHHELAEQGGIPIKALKKLING